MDKRILNAQSINGIERHLSLIDEQMLDMQRTAGLTSFDGVAMAFPGLVNPNTKKVLSTNQKYDDAPSLDLETYYQQKWNTSFFIDNDVRMATVGEWKFGAGQGSDDLVMVTLGTGVGTSVIIEGKLLRGRHYQAGCLGGHFVVNYAGKKCTCGNIGCVEAEAATWNLASLAKSHVNFSDSSLMQEEIIDFAALFRAAKAGDTIANEIKDHCLDIWTAGIISYIHAYDPEKIILGGGILKSSADILPYIKQKVRKHAWTPWGKVSIVTGSLNDAAAILGATYSLQNNL